QCQRCVLGVSQPLRNVFCLERAVLEVQVTIEQLGDFASSAWFPNLVQRSQNVLAETTTRIRNLLHRWFHRLEELTQLTPAMSLGCRATRTSMVDHRVLAGSSLISTFRIASGWCSPASPTKVYERS